MSAKEKLQIVLITYNRKKHLERTFKQILADNSPIKDYDILVLDNNSNDGTQGYVQSLSSKYPNLQYKKNQYNIGVTANIVRAIEHGIKDYLWILCDDDIYEWSSWHEVEKAISNNEKAICVSTYALEPDKREDLSRQIIQMTFVPATILKISVYNDSIVRNLYENIYTLFPYLSPIIDLVNNNEKIYVIEKGIVDNGFHKDDPPDDYTYTRGNDLRKLAPRIQTLSWIVGFSNICTLLKDKNLAQQVYMEGINCIYGSFDLFCEDILSRYSDESNYMQFVDAVSMLEPEYKKILLKKYNNQKRKSFIQKIFSISNQNNHKVIIFMGQKLTIKKIKNKYWTENGLRIKETPFYISIYNGNNCIKISPKHKIYLPDIIRLFDFYFSSVESKRKGKYDIVDFSRRSEHKTKGYDLHKVMFSSFVEPIETTQQYLEFAQLDEDSIVLDLGAYSGLTSLLFDKEISKNNPKAQGKVIAVDADFYNIKCLKNNFKLYKEKTNRKIEYLYGAAWKEDGEIEFSSEANMGASATCIVGNQRGKVTKVKAFTLSSIAKKYNLERVDFIKCDIEGSENFVFKDKEFFTKYHPRIIVETHYLSDYTKMTTNIVINDLTEAGYMCKEVPQQGFDLPLIECQYIVNRQFS